MALPWIDGAAGSQLGITQPDGWLTLLIGTIATILAWYRIRTGWMAAGFVAVLMGRNLLMLGDLDSAAPGVGLWIGTVAFAAAAVLQLIGMVKRGRSAFAGNDP